MAASMNTLVCGDDSTGGTYEFTRRYQRRAETIEPIGPGRVKVAEQSAVTGHLPGYHALRAAKDSAAWTRAYLWRAAVGDVTCAVLAGVLAIQARFVSQGSQPTAYLAFTFAIPLLWAAAIALAGGYDPRFIGVGSDEFRRILNAGVSLTATVAIVSYAFKLNVARGYVALAMPSATLLDLVMRYWLRKHLHRMRRRWPVSAAGGRGRPRTGGR